MLLLLATGFCGSLSTFSTWMAELWQELQSGRWGEALSLALTSLSLGVLTVMLGSQIGRIAFGLHP
jgi:CrcB protein